MATNIFGTGMATCLNLISELIINRRFAQYLSKGEYVSRLSIDHSMIVFMLALFLLILALGYVAFRVAKNESAKVIHDVFK